jgi:hypothetical protein
MGRDVKHRDFRARKLAFVAVAITEQGYFLGDFPGLFATSFWSTLQKHRVKLTAAAPFLRVWDVIFGSLTRSLVTVRFPPIVIG